MTNLNPDNMNQANIWQDIDTAPKKGPLFLSDGEIVVAAHWYEAGPTRLHPQPHGGWVTAGGDDIVGIFDLRDSGYYGWLPPNEFTPTHWAPMLELPGV